jgi:hypothetical protein
MCPNGNFQRDYGLIPAARQFARYAELMQALMLAMTAFSMFGMLGQGEAVTAAAALPGAATHVDLERVMQQANSLQQQVQDIDTVQAEQQA